MVNNKIFRLAVLVGGVLVLAGCGDVPANQQADYENDVKPLVAENTNPSKARGSCNMIASGSQCLDYVGSMWTQQQMELNCKGVGTFSLNSCPYSDVGGCRTATGTLAENILWSYNQGGDPITPELKPYVQKACSAVASCKWVDKPEDLLVR